MIRLVGGPEEAAAQLIASLKARGILDEDGILECSRKPNSPCSPQPSRSPICVKRTWSKQSVAPGKNDRVAAPVSGQLLTKRGRCIL